MLKELLKVSLNDMWLKAKTEYDISDGEADVIIGLFIAAILAVLITLELIFGGDPPSQAWGGFLR